MDSVKSANHLPVPDYDVERLNQAATAFTSKGSRDGMRYMISLKKADYRPISVSLTPHPRKPRLTFSSPTRRQRSSRGSWRRTAASTRIPPPKSSANVLRFSYIWKNKKLKIENDALKAHVKVHSAHARQNKTLGAPSLGRIRITNDSDGSDDEVSLYNGGYTSAHKMQCAACMTRESSVWWRCPRTITGDAMCEGCG